MIEFLHENNKDDKAKAIAIPWIFSENSHAKNPGYQYFFLFPMSLKDFLHKVIQNWNCLVKD